MSDYLPQEVVVRILTRLPPKSVIKFRCVSKSWNLLISSPYFISMHIQQSILSKSPTNPSDRFIVRHYSKIQNSEIYSVHLNNENCNVDETIKLEYPFRDFTRFYYRIVGSYNGVLCLSDDLFGYTNAILLWNPSIRRKVTLPMSPFILEITVPCMFVLGFGFDEKNNDYKVVRIAHVQGDSGYLVPHNVEIYELSVGNWREIDVLVPLNCVVEYFWTQVFLNGNVNWVAYKRSGETLGPVENLIMVFRMTDEVFEEMQLPDALSNELPINLNAAVFEESLAVFQYDARVWSKSCSIWVMKEYGVPESWSKQFYVDLNEGLGMVLGFRKNGHVLLSDRNGDLISYNPGTGAREDLGIVGTKDSFYVDIYLETLALFSEGKEARARLLSDSDSEYDSSEADVEDKYGDVEKSELRMQSTMFQYLTTLFERIFV
ncbi:F-box/kelch-repeat protein [Abeliophyllum distichum]|uniref:F-box/kelch-repeat protein n=1 Tax=Abeliophyllum distichum TaxID=126358 RepID=A0ABD1QKI7_9LAMI